MPVRDTEPPQTAEGFFGQLEISSPKRMLIFAACCAVALGVQQLALGRSRALLDRVSCLSLPLTVRGSRMRVTLAGESPTRSTKARS